MSTSFPDADAETPTDLFSHGLTEIYISSKIQGIAVTPTGIKISRGGVLYSFNFTGTLLGNQTAFSTGNFGLDYFNGDYLVRKDRLNGQDFSVETLDLPSLSAYGANGTVHSRYGILSSAQRNTTGSSQPVYLESLYPYNDFSDFHEFDSENIQVGLRLREGGTRIHFRFQLAVADDLVYLVGLTGNPSLYQLNSATEIKLLKRINISRVSNLRDVSIYRDTLYFVTNTNVQSLDIKKYRPTRKVTRKPRSILSLPMKAIRLI